MSDLRASSPISDIFSDEIDSISIRDKSLLKRSVSKHHNNNFKAGYVPVHEQHLTKTGLRGRKTFAFWTLVALLFVLAVGNLILTITILGVLRLGQGMQSIELVPEENAIKFFGDTDLDYLYKRDGKIEGFRDEPVEISARDSAILMNLSPKNGRAVNKLRLHKNGTVFRGFSAFEVKNRVENTIFSTTDPQFNHLKRARGFSAKSIQTNRITSPVDEKIKIEGRIVNLKGSEGTSIDGSEIILNADQDIFLKNINGSIILNAEHGVFINLRKIPIATTPKHGNYAGAQYKVCVCMPQGKLFRIPLPKNTNERVYCHHINTAPPHNPCM